MRLMWTYICTGLAIFGLMIFVGITMRGSQAGWWTLGPGTFYSLLSLHGIGMLTAMAVAGLGTLWYLVSREVALDTRTGFVAYGFFVAGVLCVVLSIVAGHYGALWTMLYPLPFVGTYWPGWATGMWLIGTLLVMLGFMIWCGQILGALLERYGGLHRVLAVDYVFRSRSFAAEKREPPPAQVFAAAVTAIDGLIAGSVGMTIGVALIVHWIDPSVAIDPLWAKNLTYFFGHTYANLTIYVAVAGVYVALPICTGRAWHTTVPIAVAWWGTLVFVIFAFFHHLYMDFVQPEGVQFLGELASYLAAVPVVVVTIYSGVLLVHRSGMRWTLGSMFLFTGMIGWVVGGSAALLDATIPINLDLHNTLWVPAHFHTYLLEGVLLFVLGWVFVNLEQRSGSGSSALTRWLAGSGMFGGGALFVLAFYVAGADGVPRRYAVEPAPGPALAAVGAIGALIFVVGLSVAAAEAYRLARLPQRASPT